MVTIIVNTDYLGINIFFELLFVVATLLIGFHSNKIYKLTRTKKYFLFSSAFWLISIAYIVKLITNVLIYFTVIGSSSDLVKATYISGLVEYGTIFHMLFMVAAYIMLIGLSFKIDNFKILSMLFLMSFLSILFSSNANLIFYLVLSLFLIYLTLSFYNNYNEKKTPSSLLVFLGFFMILLGQISFIFAPYFTIAYFLGHLGELAGYSFLFINLVRISRK
ncbi:hypothetical protein HYV49_03780 [Candidatus Pacearchaeota archaeon]|nr:hypothetical protein [Candidatus Pacearchaeota archaeon]